MGINAQQVQAVDLYLTSLGISIQDYIAAKQVELSRQEPEEVLSSPFLSRQEAATLLRCSVDTVDNLISAGKIKGAKLSAARCGRVLVDRKSLLAFVRRCTSRSTERQ